VDSLFLFLALTLLGCSSTVTLPAVGLPPDTLLLREFIVLGTDRSLGRRGRFSAEGCWFQAPNTWLWVHDPVLATATDPWLYFNGPWDSAPWFCLSATDRRRVELATLSLRPTNSVPASTVQSVPRGTRVVVRYAALVDGQLRVGTAPLGRELTDPDTSELAELLGSLAAEGAWAGTPVQVSSR